MRRRIGKKSLQSFVFCLLFTALTVYSADDSELMSYFQNRSIPVYDIKYVQEAVIVKIMYQELAELNEHKLESDQLMILQKISNAYPKSQAIQLEYYGSSELLLVNEYKTDNVVQFAKGRRDKASLLADASVKIQGGIDMLFSSNPPPGGSPGEEVVESGPKPRLNVDPEMVSYIGVQIAPIQPTGLQVFDVHRNSPAKHAGLRSGDIILEIEGYALRAQGVDTSSATQYLSSLPTDRPLCFHIERRGERIDVWIKLASIARKDMEELGDIRFQKFYEEAVQAQINQDYDRAISLYNKTIDVFPLHTYQGLGICYIFKKNFDDAFYYLAKAYEEYQESPLTVFFLSAALDNMGMQDEAIFCFESYFLLKDSDNGRLEFALRRLNHLKKQSKNNRTSRYRSIDDIIHTIEIKR